MDAFTKAQITALADGPLAEMGFTNPIEVSEWWQFGLRYRNGLRAIDFVIDVEFGSIFVVFIRTLKSDKAADLISLANGVAIELPMACHICGTEYGRTPLAKSSEHWGASLPHALEYDLERLGLLLGQEGAWEKALVPAVEQRRRDIAVVRTAIEQSEKRGTNYFPLVLGAIGVIISMLYSCTHEREWNSARDGARRRRVLA
jgi:hypothetical protein